MKSRVMLIQLCIAVLIALQLGQLRAAPKPHVKPSVGGAAMHKRWLFVWRDISEEGRDRSDRHRDGRFP